VWYNIFMPLPTVANPSGARMAPVIQHGLPAGSSTADPNFTSYVITPVISKMLRVENEGTERF
jgi:hypothetical protein